MTRMTMGRAFADAMAALVDEHETGDVLAQLVEHCAAVYPAAAVAVMVNDLHGDLELLSATSHRAAELELLQSQDRRGPCVEAAHTNEAVWSSDAADMTARWGDVGDAITRAGFAAVHAFPMHWRDRVIGGLNIFMTDPADLSEEAELSGQMFADLATLVVVGSTDISSDHVTAQIHEAVLARAVVEQAKGVIAVLEDVDVATAYDLLLVRTRTEGASLGEMARRVVDDAWSPRGPDSSRNL